KDTKMQTPYGQKARDIVKQTTSAEQYITQATEKAKAGRDAEINTLIDYAIRDLLKIEKI
ncbi:unnamed protein product, partial [marine sediment metagenome]